MSYEGMSETAWYSHTVTNHCLNALPEATTEELLDTAVRELIDQQPETSLVRSSLLKRWKILYKAAKGDAHDLSGSLHRYLDHNDVDVQTSRKLLTNTLHIGRLIATVRTGETRKVLDCARTFPEASFLHTPEQADLVPNLHNRLVSLRSRHHTCPLVQTTVEMPTGRVNALDAVWTLSTQSYVNTHLPD